MNILNCADGDPLQKGPARVLTRRSLLGRGLIGLLALSWGSWRNAVAETGGSDRVSADNPSSGVGSEGVVSGEIVLGMSAAFSGPSRGLGSELYRGAKSYFSHVNDNGGVGGRQVVFKLYDDGYQPDPCVKNTMKLMLEDRVFLLFGYVGTPTVTRALPLLKKFQDERVYLFFRLPAPSRRGSRRTGISHSTFGRPIARRPPASWIISSGQAESGLPCSIRPTPTAVADGRE